MAFLLSHLLTDAADRFAERDAVVFEGRRLSYAVLEAASNRFARSLRAAGVQPGDRVGLWLPKSPEAVVALYGVMKAGAAYVPVDPGAPPARLAYILRDCRMAGLVTVQGRRARLATALEGADSLRGIWYSDAGEPPEGPSPAGIPERCWGEVDAEDAARIGDGAIERDLAYILYTSGSTGEPKGVMLSHRNALAFVEWAADTFGLTHEDRLANHAPFHFDLSVFDLFAAARSGAAVYPVPQRIAAFPAAIVRMYVHERLSVWYEVPSSLVLFLTAGGLREQNLDALRLLLFAGEVFAVRYLRQIMMLIPQVRFANLYGPTETNVCTWFDVREMPDEDTSLPIGAPCRNTQVFILDESRLPVADGEVGELWVRGPTVMQGYWGRPERTAEAMGSLEVAPGIQDEAYRTGDLVRRLPDGNLEFLGRRDHQVKIRGYRVELGEIETVLYGNPEVAEVVIVAVPDPEFLHRLKAVIVRREGSTLSEADVKRHCAHSLPRYMVPEVVSFRSSLPRTSSGKVDRRALTIEQEAEPR